MITHIHLHSCMHACVYIDEPASHQCIGEILRSRAYFISCLSIATSHKHDTKRNTGTTTYIAQYLHYNLFTRRQMNA